MSNQKQEETSTVPSDSHIQSLIATNGGIVAFTATYYVSKSDVRFKLCARTIKESVRCGVPFVVVDGSPSLEVHSALRSSGAVVRRQTAKRGKGSALREAAKIASARPGVDGDTLLCWQEPEKVDMVRLWREIRHIICKSSNDVVVPWREERCFRETYPIEQVHSETFGNLYLDAALRRSGRVAPLVANSLDTEGKGQIRGVNWHFGPFAFLSKHIELWTNYWGGDSYDAQVVPIVHAFRKGLSVTSVRVQYRAPIQMKGEEEGNIDFIEKRLWQLNDLDPKVSKAWSDDFCC